MDGYAFHASVGDSIYLQFDLKDQQRVDVTGMSATVYNAKINSGVSGVIDSLNSATIDTYTKSDFLVYHPQLQNNTMYLEVANSRDPSTSTPKLVDAHGSWKVDARPNNGSALLLDYNTRFPYWLSYKIGGSGCAGEDCSWNLKEHVCPKEGCPELVINDTLGNYTRIKWSNCSAWPSGKCPGPGDDVTIPLYLAVEVDITTSVCSSVLVEGMLFFDNAVPSVSRRRRAQENNTAPITLNTGTLTILGEMQIGTAESPFKGKAEINLFGGRSTADQRIGPYKVPAKSLAVFGKLRLHGVPPSVAWTRLSETAAKGSTEIKVSDNVLEASNGRAWRIGDEILISFTGYERRRHEVRTITGISTDGKILQINEALRSIHYSVAVSASFPAAGRIASAVALLSRNIVINGRGNDTVIQTDADFNKGRDFDLSNTEHASDVSMHGMVKDHFGVVVLVGSMAGSVTRLNPTGSYHGQAMISGVQFRHFGQRGWFDAADPRYGLVFQNAAGPEKS